MSDGHNNEPVRVADWRSVERGLANAGIDRAQVKPLLAYLEQCARLENNLEALRAVRDYRKRFVDSGPR
jgi:hypothetical protein